MTSFYSEDLAQIHAAGFGQLAEAAAAEVLQQLGSSAAGARILDLGCGAGALSARLVAAGAAAWGLDISEAFVALARQRVPAGEFIAGSIYDTPLPPAKAVCAIGEVINYVAGPSPGAEGLDDLFARVFHALEPGGLLLFDAAEPGRGAASPRGFTEGDGWAVGAINSEADGVLIRRITTFRRARDKTWRRAEEVHRLRLLPRAVVMDRLAAAGFAAEARTGYGSLALPPHLVAYAARKP